MAVVSEVFRQVSGVGMAVLGAALFSRAVAGAQTSQLYPYAAGMILLGLSRATFSYLGPYLAHVAAYRILVTLRDRFYVVLESLSPARLSSRRTGDLVTTAVSDIEMLELFFAHTAGPAAAAIIVPLLALSALASLSLNLAGVLLVFLVFLSFRLGSVLGKDLRAELARLNSQVLDSLQGMRDILAFGSGSARLDELSRDSASLLSLQARQARNMGLQSAVSVSIVSTGIICVLLSSSFLVSRGELSPGNLPVSVILASSVFASLMGVVEISKQLSVAFSGAGRLFKLLDEEPAVKETSSSPLAEPAEPSVAFEEVSFRYSEDEPRILNGLSFRLRAGSTVALVGMSGAGKTTITSLMLRFWDPESGRVLLGGRDLRRYPLEELRRQFSVVSQDIFLFNDTIRENIRLGRSGASDAEVEDAASKARIHDFIASLPGGYETMVGERGIRLSGGERQRIAIARALLKGAPILILDEATSSLDAQSERAVKDTLLKLRAGRTTFMIAHRLSTVVDADEILVVKDGRVVEQGRHEELISLKGEYAGLVATQRGVLCKAAGSDLA
jgi:thiol reductant ABC exporter CydC subunit